MIQYTTINAKKRSQITVCLFHAEAKGPRETLLKAKEALMSSIRQSAAAEEQQPRHMLY